MNTIDPPPSVLGSVTETSSFHTVMDADKIECRDTGKLNGKWLGEWYDVFLLIVRDVCLKWKCPGRNYW